ncbi:DUF998 domain-containing protein [Naasia lichenicola]|uniref:DUF998 domain-containing protein n=1 Tax=Naasia lichenicola TaxID=2565933 RepID=A0A4S4FPT6_9MICO|nr:DUF998 domain-containing protein [Naasia lichenicola]THG31822.1 DUF998 domain-containing protein [Naasia lichenicola]
MQSRARARRSLALIAMAGVVLYVLVDVVLQLLPPHYSVLADAESDLAVGPFGWIMSLNFLGRAVTSAALAAALLITLPRTIRRDVGLVILALAGLCSAVLAFFPTDIPEVSGTGVAPTTSGGVVHLVAASTGFVLALVACWVLTVESRRGQARIDRPTALAVGLATLGAALLLGTITALPALLGLAERICLVGILGWVFVTASLVRSGQFAV